MGLFWFFFFSYDLMTVFDSVFFCDLCDFFPSANFRVLFVVFLQLF